MCQFPCNEEANIFSLPCVAEEVQMQTPPKYNGSNGIYALILMGIWLSPK